MKTQILIVAIFAIAGLSCQTPFQPSPSTIPVTRTVHVRDGNGNDFQGASVQLYPAEAPPPANSSPTTGSDGRAVFTPTVPPGWKWYVSIVTATSEYPTIQDSVLLGCSDTTLEFTLVKHIVIPCANSTQQDTAKCHVCLVTNPTDSALTPWLSFSCPNPLTVAATSTLPGIMRASYFKKGTTGSVSTIVLPTTLLPNEQLQAKVIYVPTTVSTPVDAGVLTLTFTSAPTVITYAFKVTGVAENCANCACPSADFVASLPKPDTVCVTDSKDTSIDLSTVHNPGDPTTCFWEFYLDQDFTDNSEIVLLSRNLTLQGGASLSEIGITFRPTQNKVYDEWATFKIRAHSQGQTPTDCPHVLKIHFTGFGTAPSCAIDASVLMQTVFAAGGTNYNLYACADQSGANTLKIINTGACPVQNITLSFQNAPGTMWQVTPANIASIEPGQTVVATVEFFPSLSDVFGSGDICNPNPLTTKFTNTLIVNGCGNAPSSYPLTGYGDPTCHPSASFFLPDYLIKHEGIQIDSGTNVVHIQPKGDTSSWFLYATTLTASTGVIGTGNVTLHGGSIPVGTPGKNPGDLCRFSPALVGTATGADGDACLIGCKYKGQCGASATGPTSVIAHSGDVFLFTYWTNGQNGGLASNCGVIHVGEIHTDANLGYTVADLDICYPIN